MLQDIIDSLQYTVKSCEALLNKEDVIEDNIRNTKSCIKEKEEYLKFLKGAKEKYQVAVDQLYQDSIGTLESMLNTSLQYIFFDKNYKAKVLLETIASRKELSLLLIDEDNGFEVDLKDGVGQGVRTVLSFVLKSYYLINQNSKVLLLDEKYSALSSHYVPRFYEFMKKFCEEHDFIIVMISHIDSQIEHADKLYYINDGVISEEQI